MTFVPQAHKPVHLLLAPRISVEQTPNCSGLRKYTARTDNIARFQTTLIENKSSPKTTLRENETTLFENRPHTSALDQINANS